MKKKKYDQNNMPKTLQHRSDALLTYFVDHSFANNSFSNVCSAVSLLFVALTEPASAITLLEHI